MCVLKNNFILSYYINIIYCLRVLHSLFRSYFKIRLFVVNNFRFFVFKFFQPSLGYANCVRARQSLFNEPAIFLANAFRNRS